MNCIERMKARQWREHQENMKNPVYKAAYEASKRKAEEERKRQEILANYLPNGAYRLSTQEEKPREKTDEEIYIESVLNNYK